MLDEPLAARLAEMILSGLHREFPYHLVHVVASSADIQPPRELTPAFFGNFDWHSSVHSHWSLARLIRLFPDSLWTLAARGAVDADLTADNIAAEIDYQSPPHRAGFERPYGLAWLLQLAAELFEGRGDRQLSRWSEALSPLVELAVDRLTWWLPRLIRPIRSGEHSQTAFAMGLCLDWARITGRREFATLLESRAMELFANDRDGPIRYEPSGHDFLSPILGEADLLRRVMPVKQFTGWLSEFLPGLKEPITSDIAAWLTPVASPDSSDGKLSHLDGLNLSRAWMLAGIASRLTGDPRLPLLESATHCHAEAGLTSVNGEHYAGAHWLGSFAIYLTTDRGL